MKTLLKIGPRDHGQPITDEELGRAEFVSGYKYEIIGRGLQATYEPDLLEASLENWLLFKLMLYARAHPEVLKYVTNKARVFIPGRQKATIPELDLAAYRDFPTQQPFRLRHWRKVSPILVGEVVSPSDPHKD